MKEDLLNHGSIEAEKLQIDRDKKQCDILFVVGCICAFFASVCLFLLVVFVHQKDSIEALQFQNNQKDSILNQVEIEKIEMQNQNLKLQNLK